MSIKPDEPISGDPLSQPSRMLALLSIQKQASNWLPSELGDILAHQLNLPLREMNVMGDGDDVTLRQLLADHAAGRSLFEQAKRIFKSASQSDGALPSEAATVLYLAVIVAAKRSGHRLTKLDDAALKERIEWALGRGWLDFSLRELFENHLKIPRAGT